MSLDWKNFQELSNAFNFHKLELFSLAQRYFKFSEISVFNKGFL